MSKGWADLLTDDAALEDTHRWFASFGQIFKNIYLRLGEPFRYFIFPYMDKIQPEEMFQRVLSVANLYPHHKNNNQLEFSISNEVNIEPPVFDSFNNLYQSIKCVYSYARGDLDVYYYNNTDYTIKNYCYVIKQMSSFHITLSELDKTSNKILETLISPRFVYALNMYNARKDIEGAYNMRIEENDFNASITPTTLATIGNVSYQYIIKLIKTHKLNAWKEKGTNFWEIALDDSLKWLLSRPNPPEWIKKLTKNDINGG